MQHLEEALGPLSKERESLLQEYKALKERLDLEYDQLQERKRGFQQEIDAVGAFNARIKEYIYIFSLLSFQFVQLLLLIFTPQNILSGTWIQRE